jgi:hypothetical protein
MANITRIEAARLLSTYISMLLRADIIIPPTLPDFQKTDPKPTLRKVMQHLPTVCQRAVDGEELIFSLPLATQTKGTSLSQGVADVVNALLLESASSPPATEDNTIVAPTFFYPDGSAMVIKFAPIAIASAMTLLINCDAARMFIENAISKNRV